MELKQEVYDWCENNSLHWQKERICVFIETLAGKIKEGTIPRVYHEKTKNYSIKLEEKNAELKKEITSLRGSLILLKRGLE